MTFSVSFVVCANFGPTRGFEVLIRNWLDCPKNAVLYLQGKDNDFKSYLLNLESSKKLIEKKQLFFPDAVAEHDIVKSLGQYNVGIIPYEPVCLNNKFSCPNKTSQYLKAGLPILSNDLPVVKRILKNSGAGYCIDFRNKKEFLKKISFFINKKNIIVANRAAKNLHKKM